MQNEMNWNSVPKQRVPPLHSISSHHCIQGQVKDFCNFIHLLTHSFTNDLLNNCSASSRNIQVKCTMKTSFPGSQQACDWYYHCHFAGKETKAQRQDAHPGNYALNHQVLLSFMVYSCSLSCEHSEKHMVQCVQITPGEPPLVKTAKKLKPKVHFSI